MCVCVCVCVCMDCLLLSTSADRDNREANFNKGKQFHPFAGRFSTPEGRVADQNHPRKVRFISLENLFMNTHSLGYIAPLSLLKSIKPDTGYHPPPFISQLIAHLRVTKSKQALHCSSFTTTQFLYRCRARF